MRNFWWYSLQQDGPIIYNFWNVDILGQPVSAIKKIYDKIFAKL